MQTHTANYTEAETALLAVYHKLQAQGITLRDFLLLREVEAGAAALTELAVKLQISTAAITVRADRLEQRRLVERRRNFADRRLIKLEITTAGRALLAALR